MEKRLYRSRSDRMIWGVCGGLAKYFDMDPTIIRVITVLSMFLGSLGIWAYIILAIVVPLEDSKAAEPKDVIKENVEEMKESASELGRELRSTLTGEEGESGEIAKIRHRRRNTLGIILIVLGILFLLGNFNIFRWFNWGNLWPLVLVAIGVLIIFSVRKRR
jgi:phage shock protein PspC (stress-responsive transcriptional regulator)